MTAGFGIDANSRELRVAAGSPYRARLRVKDADGVVQSLAGRDLALTIFRGATVIVSDAATIGSDAGGSFAQFDLAGSVFTRSLTGAQWEIAELLSDGKVQLLSGPVYILAAAPSGAGDGVYAPSSAFDDVSWDAALDKLIVDARGPRGLSAYEIARAQGFQGSEPQWIDRLGGAGFGSSNILSMIATVAMSGHRAVKPVAGGVGYPALSNPGDGALILGVTMNAAAAGALIDIYAAGEIVESAWAWALGPVFAGDAGVLTQTPPTSGWIRQVGVAVAPDRLIVSPRPAFKLTGV